MKNLTDDEINVLAEDIFRGKVFTSAQVRTEDRNMLPAIFLPLALANQKLIEEMRKETPGMIYEHLCEAGPSSINGYPTFLSVHMVSQSDTKKVWEKYDKIKKAVGEAIK